MEHKARMRSIPQAVAELKENDPNCYISEAILRRMVKRGDVPAVKIGQRPIINMDVLYEILQGK